MMFTNAVRHSGCPVPASKGSHIYSCSLEYSSAGIFVFWFHDLAISLYIFFQTILHSIVHLCPSFSTSNFVLMKMKKKNTSLSISIQWNRPKPWDVNKKYAIYLVIFIFFLFAGIFSVRINPDIKKAKHQKKKLSKKKLSKFWPTGACPEQVLSRHPYSFAGIMHCNLPKLKKDLLIMLHAS